MGRDFLRLNPCVGGGYSVQTPSAGQRGGHGRRHDEVEKKTVEGGEVAGVGKEKSREVPALVSLHSGLNWQALAQFKLERLCYNSRVNIMKIVLVETRRHFHDVRILNGCNIS